MSTPEPAAGDRRPLIAHVMFRLTIGGLENGVVNLINTMSRHRYRHAIICLEDSTDFRERIQPDDVEVREMNKSQCSRFGLYRRLFGAIRELSPAIVHTRNLGALDALPPAWLAGVPARVHGEHGWNIDDLSGENVRHRRLRSLYRPLVDHYVSVSEHLACYLRETIGVPNERVTQIYNGVDSHRFRPGEAGLPHGDFGDPRNVVIGTVGQLRPEKNQGMLVDAFARLVAQGHEAAGRLRLVVVGNGPEENDLERRVAEAGIADRVWLAGARNDIPELLRALDLFALPSKTEGISNTILEAMATGLPVVATDVGGNAELIVDGATGTLVPADDPDAMADALWRYARDPQRRSEHGSAARRRVLERFSLETMVDAYTRVYDALLVH